MVQLNFTLKLKYCICWFRDIFLFLVCHLSNSIWNTSISGGKSSWTSLYFDSQRQSSFAAWVVIYRCPLQARADRGHDVPDRPPQHVGRQQRVPVGGRGALLGPAGTNCIKIGLPGKLILGDYYQENWTSQRPFLLLRIHFPERPLFIQLPPGPPHHAVRQLPAEEGAVERGEGEGVEADLEKTGEWEGGASIYDVCKIFLFFDPSPPLSANSRNLPY